MSGLRWLVRKQMKKHRTCVWVAQIRESSSLNLGFPPYADYTQSLWRKMSLVSTKWIHWSVHNLWNEHLIIDPSIKPQFYSQDRERPRGETNQDWAAGPSLPFLLPSQAMLTPHMLRPATDLNYTVHWDREHLWLTLSRILGSGYGMCRLNAISPKSNIYKYPEESDITSNTYTPLFQLSWKSSLCTHDVLS